MQAARDLGYRVKLRPAAFAVLYLLLSGRLPGQLPSSPAQADLIDINRASISQLETLPGIRDAWAQAIVKNRPYKNKTQLLSRKIIPFAAYQAIKDQIIAKQ
jgi:competence protein ComEA